MKLIIVILSFLLSIQVFGSDSLFLKGVDNIMENNYEKASDIFAKDAEENPSFSAFYNLGVSSGNLDDWHKAKWAFESSLKYKPLNGDAQFNAEFASKQLNNRHTWEHPFPWIERVMLGFGMSTWVFFACVSSIFLGFLIYKVTSSSNINKWFFRLIAPAVILFGVSFYGVYSINMHFNSSHYAILKKSDVPLYISPNGVESQDKLDPSDRLVILKYFKNNTWIQVQSKTNNMLWVKAENVYTY
ncbi:hypothetical protein [Brumimicrobium aurantiacum]|uniref:Tetratricopeptide repeat protein n=1 Tax=Brumimicrobium aurantiacum TaxID=1737063 RepID=A0A3E1EY15_9FLAO|nr:hypothetical protein [Brumimicrobium aurantiacum]RFC54427.1 hypothetical protein DXU93_08365 [Brumimicrobium aurantiacum]